MLSLQRVPVFAARFPATDDFHDLRRSVAIACTSYATSWPGPQVSVQSVQADQSLTWPGLSAELQPSCYVACSFPLLSEVNTESLLSSLLFWELHERKTQLAESAGCSRGQERRLASAFHTGHSAKKQPLVSMRLPGQSWEHSSVYSLPHSTS